MTNAKKYGELQTELYEVQKQHDLLEEKLGEHYLKAKDSQIDSEVQNQYEKNNTEIENQQETILEIQKTLKQKNENDLEIIEINTLLQKKKSQFTETLKKLSVNLFAAHEKYHFTFFEDFYNAILIAKRELCGITENLFQLENALHTQGFFQRLITHIKIMTVKKNITAHEKKITNLYIHSAKKIIEENLLENLVDNNDFAETVKSDIENCYAKKNEITEIENSLADLHKKSTQIQEILGTFSINGNVKKQMNLIETAIEKNLSTQKKLCQETGRNIANQYYTFEGKPIKTCSENHITEIDLIGKIRVQMTAVQRQLEILNLEDEIIILTKKTEKLLEYKEKNLKKIAELQKENEELDLKIAVQIEAKTSCSNKKNSLNTEENLE